MEPIRNLFSPVKGCTGGVGAREQGAEKQPNSLGEKMHRLTQKYSTSVTR